MITLITGGTGFIGKKIVRALVKRGYKVRVLVRENSNINDLEDLDIDFVLGDITDRDSVRKAMEGCSSLFHLAALVRNWCPDKNLFYRVNVDGVKNVFESAQEAGIEKMVYTSGFLAFGPSPEGKCLDETAPFSNSSKGYYGNTQYLGAVEVQGLVKKGLPIITCLPTVVYGPGEVTYGNLVVEVILDFLSDERLWHRKVPCILGNGKQVLNYVYIDDVVEGLVIAMLKGRVGERYILGGQNVSMSEFFQTLAVLSNRKNLKRHIPFWFAKTCGIGEEIWARLFYRYPFITRAIIENYRHHWAYSSKKAQQELGYNARPLKEGLKMTLEWIKGFERAS